MSKEDDFSKDVTPEARPAHRPPHKPTIATKRRVSICAAHGMAKVRIALALFIDVKTLEKYYEAELTVGAAKRQAEVLEAQFAKAKEGSTAAAKAFLAKTEFPPLDEQEAPQPALVAMARDEKLGKKQQRLIDAQTAADGTDWEKVLPTGSTPQ